MKEQINKILKSGDSVKDILSYWLPEMISNAMLISLPPIIDSYIISSLESTTTYGTLGMVNNFLAFLIKLAEAIPVAAIAIMGRHNGAQEYEECGHDFGSTFWTTTLIGLTFFFLIFFGSAPILQFMGLSSKMILQGLPFLRLKSMSVLLIFVSLGFFAFMRAVKNTKAPMVIYMIGNIVFVLLDYTLVLGKFGFKQMGLDGSAYATIFQYIVMITIAFFYIINKKEYKKYFAQMFFNYFSKEKFLKIIKLSLPIMLDKGSLAGSYVLLAKAIAPLGKYAMASYGCIRDLERFAFLPAIGFASVITFLVSNRLGAKDYDGAKNNIKKVMILAATMLAITLSVLCIYAEKFVQIFDHKNKFTDLAAPALVFISILVVFDFVQLILAGALRGAGDVTSVMKVRFFSCLLFFTPVVTLISHMNIENQVLKFVLIYGSFYINNGIMGLFFLKRIKSAKWQHKEI